MTIIFDLGGVLVHLDWDKVCAPLTSLSDMSYDAVRKEVENGPIVHSSMLGALNPREFHRELCDRLHIDISFDRLRDNSRIRLQFARCQPSTVSVCHNGVARDRRHPFGGRCPQRRGRD